MWERLQPESIFWAIHVAISIDIEGDVPFGAGLSSSASVEVATCIALLKWLDESLSIKELALLCQGAENNFVGSPCGIMDLMVIAAGEKGMPC